MTQARQEIRTRCGLTSEAYGSAWENRNLRLINTYRSCTKGLQKTAYLHLGNGKLKYMLAEEEGVRVRAKSGSGPKRIRSELS
jgi:hypothetical protein